MKYGVFDQQCHRWEQLTDTDLQSKPQFKDLRDNEQKFTTSDINLAFLYLEYIVNNWGFQKNRWAVKEKV